MTYQFKFGANAKDTAALLKDGNYNNQRFVVPEEQVDEISKLFPGKTVSSVIGGTEQVKITSNPLIKEDVKNAQLEV